MDLESQKNGAVKTITSRVLALAVTVMLSACVGDASPYRLDAWTVPLFGKSLYRPLARVTLKEVHIEPSRYEGQHLWLEGIVRSVGEHNTHFILSGGERTLLVVQADIIDFDARVTPQDTGTLVGVVGSLSTPKKGLPVLSASLIFSPR